MFILACLLQLVNNYALHNVAILTIVKIILLFLSVINVKLLKTQRCF
jgi:hypothetical protein